MGCAVTTQHCYLVTASNDQTARLWDVKNGAELLRVKHDGYVLSAQLYVKGMPHAGEWRLVTASADGTARIWRARPRKMPLVAHEVGHQQDSLGVTQEDGGVLGVEILRVSHAEGQIRMAKVFDKVGELGQRLITAGQDGTARMWDAGSGLEICRVAHASAVNSVDFLPAERGYERLVTASDDSTVRVWVDLHTGSPREVTRLQHEASASVWTVMFDTSRKRIITASSDGTARLWDAASGAELLCVRHEATKPCPMRSAQDFLLKGKRRLLTAADDQSVRVWDLDTGQELERLELESAVSMAANVPQGRQAVILTACADGAASMWRPCSSSREVERHGFLASHTYEKCLEFRHDCSVQMAALFTLSAPY